jgi:hypothetical protein
MDQNFLDNDLIRIYIGIIWSRKDVIMDNANFDATATRDAGGRFLPGQSGNPSGKRRGTRNRATILRAVLEEGEEMAVARSVIDKAKSGDAVSARFLLGLLCPRPRARGRAITLDLPEGMTAGDTVAAFNATLLAMASGEITPDEALTITQMFDGRLKALKAWELERHLTWVRRETIPGDDLFAPDEAEEDDEAGDDTPTEPSPSGRGQGEGAGATADFADADSFSNPLPEGEGIAPNELAASLPASEAPGEDLHSACIAPDPEADSAARQAAERKLAQWSHLIAAQPGFDAAAYIEAEVQRSAALKRSSAALPGHNSRSPRALNGVGTVLR